MEKAEQRLIIALDDMREESLFQVIEQTRPFASTFKIGLALFVAYGPKIIERIRERGAEIFLDLKLHDIPMQVGRAVEHALSFSPRFLSVHAQGGRSMLTEVAAITRGSSTKVVAVTVLTSLSNQAFRELGYEMSTEDGVKHLAALTLSSGLDGLVCSPHELAIIRKEFGCTPYIICPGIRPKGSDVHDQSRVMGPAEAIKAGANALVIGRPITQAENALLKAEAIHREIGQAMKECVHEN